jgi:hypothetical protein
VEGERHPINSKERRGSSQSAFCSLSHEQKETVREAIRRSCKRGEEALVGVGELHDQRLVCQVEKELGMRCD